MRPFAGFQLTRPLRGVTGDASINILSPFISTHTPLAGRDGVSRDTPKPESISTHTPLAGRDTSYGVPVAETVDFNSHAPCGA